MTGKELDKVRSIIDQEGFDYAFMYYSDFEKVKDKEFHKFRRAYIKAAEDLREYIETEE